MQRNKPSISLGNKVKCIVSGFTGIVVAKIEYLNGCIQFGVKPPAKPGEMPETTYIDVQQLKYIGIGVAVKKKNTGGVMQDAPKRGLGLAR